MSNGPVPGVVTPAEFRSRRELLTSDRRIAGGELRHRLTETTDLWLADVYAAALAGTGSSTDGIALVALGGYGRRELCPGSDLDVAVIHRRNPSRSAAIAEAVWYPIWDTGIHLGHSVRSVAEATEEVGVDFETSTALLDARLIAGDGGVVDELAAQVHRAWNAHLGEAARWLHDDADRRRARLGDVAFSVEPNIKVAGGGLRDAQIPAWLGVGADLVDPADRATLTAARSWLADVRVALHRCRSASGEVLRLEDQDAVAAELGIVDADELMTRVAAAARDIDWVLDEVWVRVAEIAEEGEPVRRLRRIRSDRSERRRAGAPDQTGRHGDSGTHSDTETPGNARTRGDTGTHVDTGAHDVDDGDELDVTDPAEVLGRVAEAARLGRRLGRPLLTRLAAEMPPPVEPWDAPTRNGFTELLAAGPGMIHVVESLDRAGVWERLVPEWPAVRTRAQRTTHHRYTVDRHLLEAVVVAASLTGRVTRADLLLVATMLHDIGKGRGGDHTEIGVELAEAIAPRMGFDASDTGTIATLVRLHLLLPEVATRRDIDDRTTVESVAQTVGSIETLGLLAALTEADARATGPTAWTDWKAGLVRTLVERTGAALTGTISESFAPAFPSVAQRAMLQSGATTVQGEGRTLTVVAADRPRLFCRVAGALVLSGLNIVSAAVTSLDGMALEVFNVAPASARGELSETIRVDWVKVVDEVERCMVGRVAIAARVAERANTYHRRSLGADSAVRVRFDDVTDDEVVVEVDAPDAIGVLFAITQALAELDVDIRYARVETLTDRVVDAFSITDGDGSAIHDPAFRSEIERAIRHTLAT